MSSNGSTLDKSRQNEETCSSSGGFKKPTHFLPPRPRSEYSQSRYDVYKDGYPINNPPIIILDIPWVAYENHPNSLDNYFAIGEVFGIAKYKPKFDHSPQNGYIVVQFFNPRDASTFLEIVTRIVVFSAKLRATYFGKNQSDVERYSYDGSQPYMGGLEYPPEKYNNYQYKSGDLRESDIYVPPSTTNYSSGNSKKHVEYETGIRSVYRKPKPSKPTIDLRSAISYKKREERPSTKKSSLSSSNNKETKSAHYQENQKEKRSKSVEGKRNVILARPIEPITTPESGTKLSTPFSSSDVKRTKMVVIIENTPIQPTKESPSVKKDEEEEIQMVNAHEPQSQLKSGETMDWSEPDLDHHDLYVEDEDEEDFDITSSSNMDNVISSKHQEAVSTNA